MATSKNQGGRPRAVKPATLAAEKLLKYCDSNNITLSAFARDHLEIANSHLGKLLRSEAPNSGLQLFLKIEKATNGKVQLKDWARPATPAKGTRKPH